MKKIYLLTMGIMLVALSSIAQISSFQLPAAPRKKCATDEVLTKFIASHPGAETKAQFENWLSGKIEERKAQRALGRVSPTVTVAIVFHIIHDNEAVGTGRNLAQVLIQQEVLQLNKDYANLSNSPYAVSEDMGIRFALAQKDPTGTVMAEPGIDRVNRSEVGFTAPPYTVGYASSSDYLTTNIKPTTIWDPARYVNIWISEWESGILGISTFPASSTLPGLNNSETDFTAGVAIDYTTVGSVYNSNGIPTAGDGCVNPYGKGKTLTHELGHFFGLRHIWGDDDCGNDYCNDTPTHFTANSGEPTHPKPNSCGTADEMFENYMDYSDDNVLNTFTVNQGDRMEAVFANSPRRGTLGATNAGFVFPTGTNQLFFANCSGEMEVSETSTMTVCPKYKDISVEIDVDDKATAAATVTMVGGGTAVNGVDYQILTPTLAFAVGDVSKIVKVRIFDNAIATGDKLLILSYTIGSSGLTAGTKSQTMTITIIDDDYNGQINQTAANVVTLLSENFGTATGSNPVPTGWTVSNSGSATNKWVVNNTAATYGFTGNTAHISNGTAATVTNGTAATNYTKTTVTDARLTTPNMDATGLKNINVSFDYASVGEEGYDVGILYYSTDGGTSGYSAVTDASGNVMLFSGVSSSTHFSAVLPVAASGAAQLKLLFRWVSDNVGGVSPPFTIDNVVVTGRYQTVETQLNSSSTQSVTNLTDAYLYSTADSEIIARVTNVNANIGCITASVTNAGTPLVALTTSAGTYQRNSKVIQLTPATANTTASYQATFYYTTAELAAWGAIDLNTLKLVKVKDGTILTSTLTAANTVIVTPIVDDQRATKGYASFTGSFTTGFSQFLLASATVTLPVSLLTFQANANGKSILLNFSTATELNNKGFLVERSLNGTDFTKIGWVNGHINSNQPSTYTYADNFVQPNVLYYYRLRQTDLDGRETFSEIRQAKIKGSDILVSISPNPAKDQLRVFVSGTKDLADIRLINAVGQVVRSWKQANVTSAPATLDISGLAAGTYMLNINTNSTTDVEKLIIK